MFEIIEDMADDLHRLHINLADADACRIALIWVDYPEPLIVRHLGAAIEEAHWLRDLADFDRTWNLQETRI